MKQVPMIWVPAAGIQIIGPYDLGAGPYDLGAGAYDLGAGWDNWESQFLSTTAMWLIFLLCKGPNQKKNWEIS